MHFNFDQRSVQYIAARLYLRLGRSPEETQTRLDKPNVKLIATKTLSICFTGLIDLFTLSDNASWSVNLPL
ncbi:hypothetical protein M378DRAFT_913364 [Amanita muscaria Koide BX008]|uniref:Uncharacterized protein n=1 Tax=Amanita muscaria (strain Koide BX008) TaxID=946122 RepID=A0A0C2WGU1_AMAMK|nr:hypothetical protein M378DRAFT_913364 [Amanita muscaria Koide BX008]